jgi:hypothetical protein
MALSPVETMYRSALPRPCSPASTSAPATRFNPFQPIPIRLKALSDNRRLVNKPEFSLPLQRRL